MLVFLLPIIIIKYALNEFWIDVWGDTMLCTVNGYLFTFTRKIIISGLARKFWCHVSQKFYDIKAYRTCV